MTIYRAIGDVFVSRWGGAIVIAPVPKGYPPTLLILGTQSVPRSAPVGEAVNNSCP